MTVYILFFCLVNCVYWHLVTRPNTDKRRQPKRGKDQANAEGVGNGDGEHNEEMNTGGEVVGENQEQMNAGAEGDGDDEEDLEHDIDDLAELRPLDSGIISGIDFVF